MKKAKHPYDVYPAAKSSVFGVANIVDETFFVNKFCADNLSLDCVRVEGSQSGHYICDVRQSGDKLLLASYANWKMLYDISTSTVTKVIKTREKITYIGFLTDSGNAHYTKDEHGVLRFYRDFETKVPFLTDKNISGAFNFPHVNQFALDRSLGKATIELYRVSNEEVIKVFAQGLNTFCCVASLITQDKFIYSEGTGNVYSCSLTGEDVQCVFRPPTGSHVISLEEDLSNGCIFAHLFYYGCPEKMDEDANVILRFDPSTFRHEEVFSFRGRIGFFDNAKYIATSDGFITDTREFKTLADYGEILANL